MNIHIRLITEDTLSETERAGIQKLNDECFSDVDPQEAEENFFAQSFARLIAFDGDKVIGTLRLFKRQNSLEGQSFTVGGIGGVCVTQSYRGQGVATSLLQTALTILIQENCDVVCLNADPAKKAYQLYEKAGFVFMTRPISFENSRGELKFDTGTMFRPLKSLSIYELIMNSSQTFNYGKGYW